MEWQQLRWGDKVSLLGGRPAIVLDAGENRTKVVDIDGLVYWVNTDQVKAPVVS